VRFLPLLILATWAACDLQPAPPKKAPAPLPSAPGDATGMVANAPDAGVAIPQGLGPDASVRPAIDAAMAVTDACVAVGTHFAEVVIASATDVAQKAAFEQQRTQMVRRLAENCTHDNWGDDIKSCFTKAADVPALQPCFQLIRPATP
jgi:hypothetical protein